MQRCTKEAVEPMMPLLKVAITSERLLVLREKAQEGGGKGEEILRWERGLGEINLTSKSDCAPLNSTRMLLSANPTFERFSTPAPVFRENNIFCQLECSDVYKYF